MSFRVAIFRTFGAAALVVLAGAPGSASAQSTSAWDVERVRGGGYAQSCGVNRGQRICAVVYCGRGVEGMDVGLTGWEPRGSGSERTGRIAIDGAARQVTIERTEDPVVGPVWRLDLPRGERRLVDRLKAGLRFEVQPTTRSGVYSFSLRGSSAAIDRVQERCARIEDRSASAPRAGGRAERVAGPRGLLVRFGARPTAGDTGTGWVRASARRFSRDIDREIITLGRDAGDFDAVRIVAIGAGIEVRELRVTYGDGRSETVEVRDTIRPGLRVSNIIELRGIPGGSITALTVISPSVTRAGRPDIQIWARRAL